MNIRITEAQRQRYDRAAASAGISRTQFILDAADNRADEWLTEQNAFRLD